MNQPLISVIVPVYNGEKYLNNCVASVADQTYQNLEIILINDGSTDQTAAVCAGLLARYPNVRVLTLDDKGVSAARNAGIAASAGEYLTFVDADDRIRPDTIQVLYEALIKYECDIAGCGFFTWRTEQEWKAAAVQDASAAAAEKRGAAKQRSTAEKCSAAEKRGTAEKCGAAGKCSTALQFLEEELLAGNSRCWSKLYKRSVIEGTAFREGLSIGEDMLFLLELLPNTDGIVEIPYQGYGYFQNPQGAMNRKFLPKYMDQITCWELARDQIRAYWKKEELTRRARAILLMAIMLTVGKIAALPAKERKAQAPYIRICWQKLKAESKPGKSGVYGSLPFGYQLKVALFRWMPKVYVWLYHLKMRGN